MRQWLPGAGLPPGSVVVSSLSMRCAVSSARSAAQTCAAVAAAGTVASTLCRCRAVHVRRGHRVRPTGSSRSSVAGGRCGGPPPAPRGTGRAGVGAGWGVGIWPGSLLPGGLSGRAGGSLPRPGPGRLGQSAAIRSNARVLSCCTPVLVTTRSARAIAGFRLSPIGATWSVYSVIAWYAAHRVPRIAVFVSERVQQPGQRGLPVRGDRLRPLRLAVGGPQLRRRCPGTARR